MRVVLGISIQDKRQWLTQVSSWQPEEAPGVLGNNVGSLPEPGFKGAKSTKTWGPVVTFRAISSISVGAVDLNSIFPHSTEFQAPSTPSPPPSGSCFSFSQFGMALGFIPSLL